MNSTPVLVTAPVGDVVTLEDMKQHLAIDFADDDALLTAYLVGAVSQLEGPTGRLGRFLLAQTWAVKFANFEYPILRLPFVDVSSVVVTYLDQDNVTQTVDSSNYTLTNDPKSAIVIFHHDYDAPEVSERPLPVSVEMGVGYGDASDVPHSIHIAIRFIVAQWFENRTALSDQVGEMPNGVSELLRFSRVSSV